jgi:hypothetical protein
VFDRDSPLYGQLFTRFHQRTNLKSLTIYAEKIYVRGALRLPGTNVNVYAKELRFEDTAGQASLDTTPFSYLIGANQFQNGLPGQKGGDITLRVQSFFSQPGPAIRLISNGGDGQNAGAGRAGAPIAPMVADAGWIGANPAYSALNLTYAAGSAWAVSGVVISAPAAPIPYQVHCTGGTCLPDWPVKRPPLQVIQPIPLPRTVVYEEYQSCSLNLTMSYPSTGAVPTCVSPITFTWGSKVWPADGNDAIAPGKPGDGGSGGNLSANLVEPAGFWTATGGKAGAAGAAQAGGSPQAPTTAVRLRFVDVAAAPPCSPRGICPPDQYWYVLAQHTATRGKDALSVPADVPVGGSGSFSTLTDQDGRWLHPNFLWMVVAHAKDAYRGGNIAYARSIFEDYFSQLPPSQNLPPDLDQPFQQARIEMQQLLHRITSNLDYFGNPAGWVPLLSLEANMRAFTNEVESAVPLLVMSRWLRQMGEQNIKDVAAMQDAITKLGSDNLRAADDVNVALDLVPTLQFQAAEIDVQLQQLQSDLQQRTAELMARAQRNVEDRNKQPIWAKAAGVIGTIAKLFPVTNPLLGPLSQGIEFISKFNFDVSNPIQSLQQLGNVPDVTSLFKASTFDTTFHDAEAAVQGFVTDFKKNIDLRNPKQAIDTAKYLASAYEKHKVKIDSLMAAAQDKAVPQNEVEAELDRLEREDGAYLDLIQRLRDINAKKKALVDTLNQSLQTISSQTSAIDQNLLAIGSLNQNLASTTGQFDHRLAVYVRDMEQRAKERLLRYQYFMAKAYEYRMLKSYPGDFNVDTVIDGILTLFLGKTAYPGNADLSGIKSVYVESVRQIVATALSELQSQPPERSLPFLFELSASELQQLNQNGVLSLDLSPRIAGLPNEDNRHIADISVAAMDVTVNGPVSTFGRIRTIIDHQGQSTETAYGRRYNFQFGVNQQKDAPFTWGASYDVLSHTISQEKPSTAGIALLESLLNITGPVDPAMLFARPGADAVVRFSKVQDPVSMNAQITRLRIAVTVDFFRSATNLVKLKVATDSGSLPYVTVDRVDISGRADGLGNFARTYNLGERVTLVASPFYAGLKFRHWADEAGSILGTSPTLVVTMGSARTVHPVYDAIENLLRTDLVINFGATYGTWVLSGSTSTKLHELSPVAMVTGDLDGNGLDDLVVNFGTGVGVWAWMNHTTWTFIHALSPTQMVTGDFDHNGHDEIAFVFSGYGVWRWNDGSWSQLHHLDAAHMAVGDVDGAGGDDLILDLPGYGVYVLFNNSVWKSIHGLHARSILTADLDGDGQDEIVIDFPNYGVWVYRNASTWTLLHALSPVHIAAGDIDGDGRKDLVIDFGAPFGLWTYRNNTTWVPLHPLSAEDIVVVDRDGSGKDEVVVDFGPSYGLWEYANDGSWSLVNGQSPRSMATGRFH